MQTVIVTLIVVVAALYVARAMRARVRSFVASTKASAEGSGCSGCSNCGPAAKACGSGAARLTDQV